MLAHLGALGDEAQAVEIGVGAAGHRHQGLPAAPLRSTYALAPAMARAPAGSRMERVSSNTSLIAAQVSSVSTRMISSTSCWHRRKVSLPTCFTATPSANRPTCARRTRRPALSERAMASESTGCTPMIRISGRRRLT